MAAPVHCGNYAWIMGVWPLRLINFLCLAVAGRGLQVATTHLDLDHDRHLRRRIRDPPMIWPAILTGFVVALVFGMAFALSLFRILLRLVGREDRQ
jgi:hypothetical protein